MASKGFKYLPSLEGIRGYAFLLVFAAHFAGSGDVYSHGLAELPLQVVYQITPVAIPIFFALSGYLITSVLLSTRSKQGFFRVFYGRRVLRVFPLYYLTLLGVGAVSLLFGTRLHADEASFLLYVQNLLPSESVYNVSGLIDLHHLWSLGVEEQFYLLWPVVIWLIPNQRRLLTICYSAAATIMLARLATPLMGLSFWTVNQNTFFRMDTIMLGSALAIHQRDASFELQRFRKPAMVVALGGAALIVLRALVHRQALPFNTFGVVVILPLISLMGLAILVLTLLPGTALSRACVQRWVVHLGQRSYSLYVLHYLFVPLFRQHLLPALSSRIGATPAHLAGPILIFIPIYALSALTYRFVEQPSMDAKRFFCYGEPLAAAPQPAKAVPAMTTVIRIPTRPGFAVRLAALRVRSAEPESRRTLSREVA